MTSAFRRLQEKRRDGEEGFTLIELLVVIIIIGILAAIAIPVFLAQRQKAYQASAESDLRNAVTAQEAYFTDYNTYAVDGSTAWLTNTYGLKVGGGNQITVSAANSSSWRGFVVNSGNTDKTCYWNTTGYVNAIHCGP